MDNPSSNAASAVQTPLDLNQMAFEKQNGLLPVVVQEHESKEVLMLAYVDPEALEQTLKTGKAHYYSRSKGRQWMKGESSGHTQTVHEVWLDCDQDTLVFLITQNGGAACHTGRRSCFFTRIDSEGRHDRPEVEQVFDPKKVYG